jgi:hypothetical protein
MNRNNASAFSPLSDRLERQRSLHEIFGNIGIVNFVVAKPI